MTGILLIQRLSLSSELPVRISSRPPGDSKLATTLAAATASTWYLAIPKNCHGWKMFEAWRNIFGKYETYQILLVSETKYMMYHDITCKGTHTNRQTGHWQETQVGQEGKPKPGLTVTKIENIPVAHVDTNNGSTGSRKWNQTAKYLRRSNRAWESKSPRTKSNDCGLMVENQKLWECVLCKHTIIELNIVLRM